MKNIANKKTLVLTLVLAMVMAFTLAGCGGGDDGGKDADKGGALSEKDYVAKVSELYGNIESTSADAMAGVDTTDTQAVIDATQQMINDVKPIFEELGGLQAPEKYADQQAKIKAGCEASVKTLDLSLELTEMAVDAQNGKVSAEDTQKKTQEITSQMAELQAVAADFSTAIAEVMADAE